MHAGRPISTILDELTMLERELDAATNGEVRAALEVVMGVLRAEYTEACETQAVETDDLGDPGRPVGFLDVERRPIDA